MVLDELKEGWDGGYVPVFALSFSLDTSRSGQSKAGCFLPRFFFVVNPIARDLILIL